MNKRLLLPSSLVLLGASGLAWAESQPGKPARPEDNPDFYDAVVKTRALTPGEPGRTEPAGGAPSSRTDGRTFSLNDLIVRTVQSEMPHGGAYATNASAFAGLRAATSVENNQLRIRPEAAQPNFCSGATYLVFLSVIEKLQRGGQLTLDVATMEKLQVRSEPDGVGIWGRWNANGPGTARLFHELSLGRSFASYAEAKPGDFVKLFWNDGIGSTERGHSAIFLGLDKDRSGVEFVSYWSSNQSNGFGFVRKERSKIKRVLFSRLENPEALAKIRALPQRDDYLAAMLKRPSTPAEMYRMVGVTRLPAYPSGADQPDAAPPASAPPAAERKPAAKVERATPAASPAPKKGPFGRPAK